MIPILIAGAGQIGRLIACMLADSKDYQVHLTDIQFDKHGLEFLKGIGLIECVELDIHENETVTRYIKKHKIKAVISCLPYFLTQLVADIARQSNIHYFDLTEDIQVTDYVKQLAKDAKSAFVPQCGLAPGFVNIAANSLLQSFDECFEAKLRVGALPQYSNNTFHYAATWSLDGLINEYAHKGHSIDAGEWVECHPLEGLETIQLEGCQFEAFNTSGGLGSLAHLYRGKINTLNYKTLRYPGHCKKMRFLLQDLRLQEKRALLKEILEPILIKTKQDVVILYISTTGKKNHRYLEKNYVKKIYPKTMWQHEWSAIQVSTSAGVCAIVDLMLQSNTHHKGLVLPEQFQLSQVLNNRFGQVFKTDAKP